MPGQINRIGNDGGRGVRLRCGPRHYGDGVGDAERETAPVASAGGDPSRGIIGADDHRSHQAMIIRPIHQTYGELLSVRKVQRDVAAIVDVNPLKLRRAHHRAENLFGD